MLLQAHRGLAKLAPENTMAAYRLAAERGFGYIELDPKCTADGHWVLFHDNTPGRTLRPLPGNSVRAGWEHKLISSFTLSELRGFEAGSWFAPEFAGEPVPEVSEVLTLANDTGIRLKFDNCLFRTDAVMRSTFYRIVRESGAENLCGITFADVSLLEEICEELPGAELHYDGPFGEKEAAALARRHPDPEKLTVWLPIRKMSWLPYPPAGEAAASKARELGKLGLWIAYSREDFDLALRLSPDILETDGSVLPEDL